MKRYIVIEVSKATADNAAFHGETAVTYTGRNGFVFRWSGSHYKALDTAENNHFRLAGYYGYRRRQDAMLSYAYRHPENGKYWKATSFIMEIDV